MEGKSSNSIALIFISSLLIVALLIGCGQEMSNQSGFSSVRANLQITPFPLYDFGTVIVGQSVSRTFTVKNAGKIIAESMQSEFYLSLNFRYEGGQYPGTSGTCGASLEPEAQCTVVVVFAPQYASSFSETLRIAYTDAFAERTTENPLLFGKGIGN